MIVRKKKLVITQITLFIIGVIIIYVTYSNINKSVEEKNIVSSSSQKLAKEAAEGEGNVFKNIEYAGIDLAGNRYNLKSKEAITKKNNPELVEMSNVEAVFYFKDETILYIWSKFGLYNSKTLDMQFEENVKALYEESELFADKAEYSNSKSFITISDNVEVIAVEGNLFADKLDFDLEDQTLNITSFKDSNINANIKLNEKRF